MKSLMFLLALGLVSSDKLDRTYLPPPGSKLSGGSDGAIQIPLEFPKESYSTTAKPSSGLPITPEDTQLTVGIDRGTGFVPGRPQTSPSSTPLPDTSSFQSTYKVPTTTTSYAFTQTTTFPPVDGFETTLSPIGPAPGFPGIIQQGPGQLNYPQPSIQGQQVFPGQVAQQNQPTLPGLISNVQQGYSNQPSVPGGELFHGYPNQPQYQNVSQYPQNVISGFPSTVFPTPGSSALPSQGQTTQYLGVPSPTQSIGQQRPFSQDLPQIYQPGLGNVVQGQIQQQPGQRPPQTIAQGVPSTPAPYFYNPPSAPGTINIPGQQIIPNQQGQFLPGHQGQFIPGQQGQIIPSQQSQIIHGQQGLFLPGQQGQIIPGQQGQIIPGQQGLIRPGQQGQITPGTQGQITPGQYGLNLPGQQGQIAPGQQGQIIPGQQGLIRPGQQGQITPGTQGQITPGQQGLNLPEQQGQIVPGQQGQIIPGQQGLIRPGQITPGTQGQITPGQYGLNLPGQQGQIAPGQQGQIIPGQQGLIRPGQQGQITPGTQGQITPGQYGLNLPGQQGQIAPGQQGQLIPGQQGLILPGQQGQITPGTQGQTTLGQQGLNLPGQQGQIISGQRGQIAPGQQDQILPGQNGLIQPGQQGQIFPGIQGQIAPGQQGLNLPGQQGQITLGQQGQIAPGQQGQIISGQPGLILPGQGGKITPGAQPQILPGQQGLISGQQGQFIPSQQNQAQDKFVQGQQGQIAPGQQYQVIPGQVPQSQPGQRPFGQVGVPSAGTQNLYRPETVQPSTIAPFPSSATSKFPSYGTTSANAYSSTTPRYPGTQPNMPQSGAVIRPERPQAESDRNAVILNYENVLTPEGYSYSYDTSNGIHADESGIATDGVKAQGEFSYTGDDGQVYSVIYSADENGFLPRGDHLPTPPPVPEAIQRVIEMAEKDKEAGIYHDGSYDEAKYGHEKYQRPKNRNRPSAQGQEVTNGDYKPATLRGQYDMDKNKKTFEKSDGARKPITQTEDYSEDNEEEEADNRRGPGISKSEGKKTVFTQPGYSRRPSGGSSLRVESDDNEERYGDDQEGSTKYRPTSNRRPTVPGRKPAAGQSTSDDQVENQMKDENGFDNNRRPSTGKFPSQSGGKHDSDDSSYETQTATGRPDSNRRPGYNNRDENRPSSIGKLPSQNGGKYDSDDSSYGTQTATGIPHSNRRPGYNNRDENRQSSTGKLPSQSGGKYDSDDSSYDTQTATGRPVSNRRPGYNNRDENRQSSTGKLPSQSGGKYDSDDSSYDTQTATDIPVGNRRPGYNNRNQNRPSSTGKLPSQNGGKYDFDDSSYNKQTVTGRPIGNKRPGSTSKYSEVTDDQEPDSYLGDNDEEVKGTGPGKRPLSSKPKRPTYPGSSSNVGNVFDDESSAPVGSELYDDNIDNISSGIAFDDQDKRRPSQGSKTAVKQQTMKPGTGYQYIPPKTKFGHPQTDRFPTMFTEGSEGPRKSYDSDKSTAKPFITPNVYNDEEETSDETDVHKVSSTRPGGTPTSKVKYGHPGADNKDYIEIEPDYEQDLDDKEETFTGSRPAQPVGNRFSSTRKPTYVQSTTGRPINEEEYASSTPGRPIPKRPTQVTGSRYVPKEKFGDKSTFETSPDGSPDQPSHSRQPSSESRDEYQPRGGYYETDTSSQRPGSQSTLPSRRPGDRTSSYRPRLPSDKSVTEYDEDTTELEPDMIRSGVSKTPFSTTLRPGYERTNAPEYTRPGSQTSLEYGDDGIVTSVTRRPGTKPSGRPGFTNIPSTTYRPGYTYTDGTNQSEQPGIVVDGFGRPISAQPGTQFAGTTTLRPGYAGTSTSSPVITSYTPTGSPAYPTRDGYPKGEVTQNFQTNEPQFGHTGFGSTQGPYVDRGSGKYGPSQSTGRQDPYQTGQSTTEKIIGEDFSGPKRPQGFDPKYGYYY